MRLGVFTTAESYAKWHMREANAIEANGLRMAREQLARAKQNGCADFLAMNPAITEEHKAEACARYIKWLEDDVRYLDRKVRKYRRLAQQALAEA